ncbi:hypothetical protein BH10PSE2_BH10PSE2_27240 [soil metagenome]
MRPFLILLTAMSATLAGAAVAQIAPYPTYGQPYPAYGATAADRQRYEMEQVRVRGVEAETLSRQQSLETRLTLRDLQDQRDATLSPDSRPGTRYAQPRSLEQERSAREAATTARQTTVAGVTQIDDWLNRSPH